MRSMLRSWWCRLLTAALVAVPAGHAWAQGAPVQFIAVVGDVRIVGRDGTQRAAARGGELREGETLLSGANGLAQLRLADGGMISVRGNTELKLDRFAYRGQDDRNASLLVSLLKGGFRSVTGLIGQLNRDGYKINTPFATIGIRGTVHNPFVQLPAPPGQQTPVAPGAYDYVEQGAIAMQTPQGQTLTIGAQQAGFISPAGAAQILPTVPPIFRREAPRPAPQQTDPRAPKASDSRPGDGTGQAAVPGTVRQIDPGGQDTLRTTPFEAAKPPTGATGIPPLQTSPALQGPVTQPMQPGPSTIQTMPSGPIQTAPIQTTPTSPILQPGPTSPLQTPPMMKPGPISPMMPPK